MTSPGKELNYIPGNRWEITEKEFNNTPIQELAERFPYQPPEEIKQE